MAWYLAAPPGRHLRAPIELGLMPRLHVGEVSPDPCNCGSDAACAEPDDSRSCLRNWRVPADRHEYLTRHYTLDRDQKMHLKLDALSGVEIVDSAARLCAMNLYLHGTGGDVCPVTVGDSLNQSLQKPGTSF